MTMQLRPGCHLCPGPNCTHQVPRHMLMCRRHWFQVPLELRREVWATWENGRGAGTPEHNTAMWAAIVAIYPPEEG